MINPTNYTIPRLVESKRKDSKGKNKAYFYIVYYYLHPATQKKQRIIITDGLNRVRAIKERRKEGKELVKYYTQKLKTGYNPFLSTLGSNSGILSNNINAIEAINIALTIKVNQVKKRRRATESERVLKKKKKLPYKSRVGIFCKWLGENGLGGLMIKDLKSHIFQHFFDSLLLKPTKRGTMSVNTIRNYRTDLKVIMKALRVRGYIESNPVDNTEQLDRVPSTLRNFSSEKTGIEVMKFMKSYHSDLADFCQFVYYMLTRIEETLSIKIKYIDLQNKTVLIPMFKNGKFKLKAIPPSFMPILIRRLQNTEATKDDLLFGQNLKVGKLPSSMRTVETWHKNALEAGGFYKNGLSPYSWKYFGISRLRNNRIKNSWIMEQSGHKTESSMLMYDQRELTANHDLAAIFPEL